MSPIPRDDDIDSSPEVIAALIIAPIVVLGLAFLLWKVGVEGGMGGGCCRRQRDSLDRMPWPRPTQGFWMHGGPGPTADPRYPVSVWGGQYPEGGRHVQIPRSEWIHMSPDGVHPPTGIIGLHFMD